MLSIPEQSSKSWWLLLILFRQKYPRWWFDWNVAFLKFLNRVSVYLLLLRDEYPSTDEEQSVHLEIPYPNAERDLNRWVPLVKWLLAIPHYIILWFLWIAVIGFVIIAWFSILFTGRYPAVLFDFVVGVMRWHNRVLAYAFLLVTDRYPPFRLRFHKVSGWRDEPPSIFVCLPLLDKH